MNNMEDKVRYSDAELEEFRTLVLAKLEKAQAEYDSLRSLVVNDADNSDADTAPTFKALEEGANPSAKKKLCVLHAVRLISYQS